MSKDKLIDKLDNELLQLEHSTPIGQRDDVFYGELELKTNFRNALYNTPLSDVLIQALSKNDDTLHDMYNFLAKNYNSDKWPDSAYDVASDYLNQIEHETLSDMVYKKADSEFKAFREELHNLPPNAIIEKAYELVMKENILGALENTESQSITDLRAFMAMPNCLESIYQEWLDNDLSFMDDIRFTIDYAAKEYASKYGINDEERLAEIEGESELEQ